MFGRRFVGRFLAMLTVLGAAGLPAGCGGDDDQGAAGGGPDEPAALTITYPEEGSFVARSRFRVRGAAEDAAEVSVNGKTAPVVDGDWEVFVDFDEGRQTVTATAGDHEATLDFTVDTVPPTITLDSPVRGRIVDASQASDISFAGVASDAASGLKVIALDGASVSFDEHGVFSHTAELSAGYNEFNLRVVDRAGNETATRRAVLFGPLAEPTAEIDSAAEFLLGPGSFEAATTVIEALMTPERITQFVKSSLSDVNVVDVNAADFDSIDVQITPHSRDNTHPAGYLAVEVDVKNFRIDGTETFSGDGHSAKVRLDRVSIGTDVTPAASDDDGLSMSFAESSLKFAPDALHVNVDDYSEQDLGETTRAALRAVAKNGAQAAFSGLLSDQLFERLYDPGVLHRTVTLLGRTLEFQLGIKRIRTTEDGVYVNASLAIVSPRADGVPPAAGALNLAPGNRTAPTISGDVLLTTRRSAVNRILHGLWRGGLLSLDLTGDDFSGISLPVELNASALSLLLDDRIGSLDTSSTPAGLKLRPQLPPVTAFGATGEVGSDIDIKLGDLLVDLRLLPEDGQPIEVATVALFIDLHTTFAAEDGQISVNLKADARADIAQEPTIDLDDQAVERLFSALIRSAAQLAGHRLQFGSDAQLDWLTVDHIQTDIHGVDGDQLSVAADVAANPAAIH